MERLHGYLPPFKAEGRDVMDANDELIAVVTMPLSGEGGEAGLDAAEALAALFARAPRVEWLLSQIIGSLPAKRDWLDPALEREAREVLKVARSEKCPTCESPSPNLHPAMQFEGEVQPCRDKWHTLKVAARSGQEAEQ